MPLSEITSIDLETIPTMTVDVDLVAMGLENGEFLEISDEATGFRETCDWLSEIFGINPAIYGRFPIPNGERQRAYDFALRHALLRLRIGPQPIDIVRRRGGRVCRSNTGHQTQHEHGYKQFHGRFSDANVNLVDIRGDAKDSTSLATNLPETGALRGSILESHTPSRSME